MPRRHEQRGPDGFRRPGREARSSWPIMAEDKHPRAGQAPEKRNGPNRHPQESLQLETSDDVPIRVKRITGDRSVGTGCWPSVQFLV